MEPLTFRKSARCEALNQSGCVEVANGQGFVAVRDSTDQSGPQLRMTRGEWRRLIRGLRSR
ncbi:DUF397 domain-containing protein [Actinomadura vinacea]|uniref:DUF397 domain-containing protein n=1 Tax=Actinomadura vinacea TaxID=115336 RepID=UPI0031DE0F1E